MLLSVSFGTYRRRRRDVLMGLQGYIPLTTETSLGVSFETCLRGRGDALMGRRCYVVLLRPGYDAPIKCRGDVPLRRLGNVPRRRRWVFHLRCNGDVARTHKETSFRRRYNVLLPVGLTVLILLQTFKITLNLSSKNMKLCLKICQFKFT